jgi:hypothetical protein
VLLQGSLRALLLYDVAEEIQLEQVPRLLGAGSPQPKPAFRGPSPEYVRFERPPVVDSIPPLASASGEQWRGVVKFYDYGVVSVALELPFESDWTGAIRLAARWIGASDIEKQAAEVARRQVERIRPALLNPNAEWKSEDYYVVHVLQGAASEAANARALLADHGQSIAQIVRGDAAQLSEEEKQEVLRGALSYYPTDLLVAGWGAAFIYDTPEGAAPSLQLLEYANTQLLEFRYYDDMLTKVLEGVRRRLGRRGLLSPWRLAGQAKRLNRMRLDIIELTERIDTSIKFLSDMFYARAYRLAAEKIGVPDYRHLVEEKLRIAADLYQSMVGEYYQARGFALEAMVVAILIIELFFLFKGVGIP